MEVQIFQIKQLTVRSKKNRLKAISQKSMFYICGNENK